MPALPLSCVQPGCVASRGVRRTPIKVQEPHLAQAAQAEGGVPQLSEAAQCELHESNVFCLDVAVNICMAAGAQAVGGRPV